MKKLITFALQGRPDYLRSVLEALRKCDGIHEYLILPHIEPGNEEVLSLVKSIDFAKVQITLNQEKLGITHNTYQAWQNGFTKSDFIIHFEDDMIPSRDCLRYVEHCSEMYRDDPKVFSITAYNQSQCRPFQYHFVSRRSPCVFGLVGIWRNRWEWIKNNWSRDPDSYAAHLTNYLAKFELNEIYPHFSRSQHVGAKTKINAPCIKKHGESVIHNYELHTGVFKEVGPLVTAVMITGMHQARYRLARVAIECFKRQTYPNKELLIINHGSESLFTGDSRVQELRLKKGKADTVGDLRNLGLKHATGDFIINWDDDDWHHPKRIEIQMAAQKNNAAVFLKNRIHYSFKNDCALYSIIPSGGEGTILHPKTIDFCYPNLLRGSDTVFASRFTKRIALDNDPSLYVRFYHGLNLWSNEHVMRHMAAPGLRHKYEINPEHQRFLKRILLSYNGLNLPK
jgi:hypothetical protein